MKRVQEIVQSMFRMLNSAIAGIYGLMMIFIVIFSLRTYVIGHYLIVKTFCLQLYY